MWKRLFFHFLLLLSVQMAIAQSTRYEYWTDNDYDGRTIATTVQMSVPLELDVSTMPTGLHYFNFRAQDESGQWGGLSRYLFFLKDSEKGTARYEYWLDNDYAERKTVNGTPSSSPISIDLNTLSPGLHYFNFRTQGSSGQWGALSRYMFYLRDSEKEAARYEYWLDNDYAGRKTINGTPSSSPISIDLNTLSPGLHYFNFRTQGSSGQWGALSRYLFFLKEDISRFAGIEYWIDSDKKMKGTQQVADGKVMITVDLSDLPEGKHDFYIHGRSQNGHTLPIDQYEFTLSEQPVVETPVITHDGDIITITSATADATIYYTTDGSTPDEKAQKYEAPFTVEHNCLVKAIGIRKGHINSAVAQLSVNWFKVADVVIVPVGTMVVITTATKGAEIHYTSDGSTPTAESELYTEPLSFDHDVTVKAIGIKANWNDSKVTSYEYKVAALTVATPTFALENNVLTITTATEGAAIYYTTDGSEPTTESTLYTAPITLTGNCMVKAFAVKEGRYDSPIAEYPVNWFKVADVVFSVSGLQLAMATETEGATIRYTTDGTLPSAEVGTEYTAPIEVASLGDDCTVQAFAMKANFSQSEVTVFEYHRVNYVTATPSIDFHEADSTVTISCATEGAAIHYTLDGSEPTVESPAYTSPFNPMRNCTVKAIATADGRFASTITELVVDGYRVLPVMFTFDGKRLTLATVTDRADIHYTIDGSDPTEGSTAYTVPILIESTATTVRAIAIREGWTDSYVSTWSANQTSAPSFTENRADSTLAILCTTEWATIHYTTDGSEPTEASTIYTYPITLTGNCTIKAMATSDGLLPSETSVYEVNWFETATPTFAVNEYTLTISTETKGAAIHYTMDGTEPTEESALYTAPITLTQDCTVKAIAVKEGYHNSGVAIYTADWVDLKKRLLDEITQCTIILHDLIARLQEKATVEEAPYLYSFADHIAESITDTEDKLFHSWTLEELKNCADDIENIRIMLEQLAMDIEAYGSSLGTTATPVMALNHATGTLTITCATAGSIIYYIIGDGATQAYNGTVTLTDNSTVRAWATTDGYDDSAEAALKPIQNGTANGQTFRISGAVTAQELLFLRNVMGGQVEHLDMADATLTDGGLADEAFRGMGLLTAQLPKSVGTVGSRLFNGCRRLAAVVWNAPTDITATALEGIGNPNLLLYVGSETTGRNAGVRNRIVNGTAKEITLSDPTATSASDCNFFCPVAFTANHISYSHIYTQQTGMDGNSRGWETLALPFDVKQVEHRVKGAVVPFGNSLAAPHFWLYSLGNTGWVTATTIAANSPYIIAMPQHPDYAEQYCLGGDSIVFSATNAAVPATAPQQATAGAKTLHANFTAQAASDDIFAINIGDPYDDTHPEGSIFLSARRAVRPFEAYTTTTASGVRFIELFDDEADGIIEMESGRLKIDATVYDLQGRKQNSDASLKKGIYIIGGQKTIIRK